MLETLGRVDTKRLTVDTGKSPVRLFDPRIDLSIQDVTSIDQKLAGMPIMHDLIVQAVLLQYRSVIANVLGMPATPDGEFMKQLKYEYHTSDHWLGRLRHGSLIKLLKPEEKITHFDENPREFHYFAEQQYGRLTGVSSLYPQYLEDSWRMRVLYPASYPNTYLAIEPDEQEWGKIFEFLSADYQITPGRAESIDPSDNLALMISSGKWAFPSKMSEFDIKPRVWEKWRKNLANYRQTDQYRFAQLAASLTLITADNIEFGENGLKLTFSPLAQSFDSSTTSLPERRKF